MRRLAIVLLAGLTFAPAVAFAQFAPVTRVIVDVFAGTNPATVAAKHGIRPQQVFTEVANAFTADLTARQIALLQADRDVQQVAADGIAGRIPRPRISLTQAQDPPSPIPQQPPQFTTAAIRRVKAPLSVTADIDKIDDRRVDADIAILDGGVDPYHPDLNVVGGVDCVGQGWDKGWHDRDGHGTLVAGFAAAIDNAIGVVGVAPGARIWAVRVADPSGLVTDSALLCGLEYSAKNRAIEVANLSFAGENVIVPCREQSQGGSRVKSVATLQYKIHERICRLVERGVTVVAAAGNYAADAGTFTPAAYEEVIAVSGFADFDGLPGGLVTSTPPVCFYTERDDHFATFSNYGAVVDIAAPAVCVTATFPGGRYATAEGTSFAAPMVAGAAALLYARSPGISPAEVRQQIIDSAERNTLSGDPDAFPDGVLDVSSF